MSYDLELFRKKGLPPLTAEEVQEVAALIPRMEVDDSQLVLTLPNSDHTIIFDLEEIEASYEYSGIILNMHIAYGSLRATSNLFSKTCDFLVRNLDLVYFDPQGDEEMPAEAFGSYSPWRKGESKVEKILKQVAPAPAPVELPSETAQYVREYNSTRPAMEGKWLLGDIYVPRIIALQSQSTGASSTAVVWPNPMSMVIPDVEHVVIGSISAVVTQADLKAAIGEDLPRYAKPLPHYLARPDKRPHIKSKLRQLPRKSLAEFLLSPDDR